MGPTEIQSLGKEWMRVGRRPLSCAEGETEAPQVNEGGSRVSPRPPWGQELIWVTPPVPALCARMVRREAEGGGGVGAGAIVYGVPRVSGPPGLPPPRASLI